MPPEDVGGVRGFREFLAAIKDPTHEEHESWLTWCGGGFDIDEFHIDHVNTALKHRKVSTRLLKAKKARHGLF